MDDMLLSEKPPPDAVKLMYKGFEGCNLEMWTQSALR